MAETELKVKIGTTEQLSAIPAAKGTARANTDEQSFSIDNPGGEPFEVKNGLPEVVHDGSLSGNGTAADPLKASVTAENIPSRNGGSAEINIERLPKGREMVYNGFGWLSEYSGGRVNAVITEIAAGHTGMSALQQKIYSVGRNLIDEGVILPGTQAGVSYSFENGKVRITGTSTNALRIKLTNGFSAVTTTKPASWNTETLPYRNTQLNLSVCNFTGNAGMAGLALVFNYSDGTSDTVNRLQAAPDKVVTVKSNPAKTISCVYISMTSGTVFSDTFNIMLTREAVTENAQYERGYTPVPVELPGVIRNAPAKTDITVPLYPYGCVYVDKGADTDYPSRITFASHDMTESGNAEKNILKKQKKYSLYNIPSGLYNPPESLFIPKAEADAVTYVQIYDAFDAVVSAYPSYASKTELGRTDGGLPVNAYYFTPVLPGASAESIPKFTLTSGTHGAEIPVLLALKTLFEQLAGGYTSDPILEFLRYNARFAVLPVANPYGTMNKKENYGRTNMNGVNINRNFNPSWEQTAAGDGYSGTEPMSEKESRIADIFLRDNNDAVCAIDFHNWQNDGAPLYQMIYTNKYLRDLYSPLIIQSASSLKKRYPSLPQGSDDFFGLVAHTGTYGTGMLCDRAAFCGMPAFLADIRSNLAPDGTVVTGVTNDPFNQRLSLEFTVNSLLTFIRAIT